jgi:peptidoglycan/LPS O-acetylase OafA/YrhL
VFLIVAAGTGWTRREPPGELLKHLGDWLFFTVHRQSDINGFARTDLVDAGVTWTLRLEWIFYLMIPFCGWFAGRLWRTVAFLALAVALRRLALATSTVDAVPLWLRDLFTQYSLFLMFYFAGGIAVAAARPVIRARWPNVRWGAPVFSAVGLALGGAALFLMSARYGRGAVWWVVPFGLIALGNDWFGFLTSAPMQVLGRISYSLYLLHGIFLGLGFMLVQRWHPAALTNAWIFWPLVAVAGGAVIALSALSYRWFEAPFTRTGKPKAKAQAQAV